MDKFVQHCGQGYYFVKQPDKSVESMLMRIYTRFEEYCESWNEECIDVPSKLCHNLLTMLEAYFRCVAAVKIQHFWLLEDENLKWQGSYKVSNKDNYFKEGLQRIEMLYGDGLTNVELEELRCNRFFKMTESGNAMSQDDVNEMVNLWFKKFLDNDDLTENVNRSKHVCTLRCCAFESFGFRQNKCPRMEASKRVNIDQLKCFLASTGIFEDSTSDRPFEDEFFWRHVQIPKAAGTPKDKAKETVEITEGQMRLQNVLCVSEEMQGHDMMEVDEDEIDDASLRSSRAGSVMSSRAGSVQTETGYNSDGSIESKECNQNDIAIDASLKKMANVRKQKRSPLLMRFMLGCDGDDAMHDTHTVHTKEKTRERKKEELILVANRHFECKMEKRMNKLVEKKSQSELNTYTRRKLSWRNRYRIRMQELRVDVPRDGGNRK
jgi:hypothetical protein